MTLSGAALHGSRLLAIDIGTTHCKAGLFDLDGRTLSIASRPMVTQHPPGYVVTFDPDALWENVTALVRQITEAAQGAVLAIGITSMAESGLLLDRATGAARTPILPWFDTSTQPQADRIAAADDAQDFYLKTGVQMRYKCTPAKLLWLKERHPQLFAGSRWPIWLSTADYVACKLTGDFGTDYSLAGRSGAFDINTRQWDQPWLQQWGLAADLFPKALPSGAPLGGSLQQWESIGIPAGTPVAVSGHDHLCAALGAGATEADTIFDSMGTAEVLTGAFAERPLNERDFASGLSSGCHVVHNQRYWFGSMSTSGGAVEWIRQLFNREAMSYDELQGMLHQARPDPTGILFLPYLLGSGAPHSDSKMRAAWIGLQSHHGRSELAKAVLEGTAYEAELMRRAGEQVTGQPITALTAAGGGTRNKVWMQIKADVCGCPIRVSDEPEAALVGAALAAAVGCGIAHDFASSTSAVIEPDARRHALYRELFEEGYLHLLEPLRRFSHLEVLEKLQNDP